MERNNGPAKPVDICRRLFNFVVKNFSMVSFKQLGQGRTNTTIPINASPSTLVDKESQVQVTIYKGDEVTVDKDDAGAGLVPPTVVTVEHRATPPKASHEDSITSKDQVVGAPPVKQREKSIIIREEKDMKDVKPREKSITIREEKDMKDVGKKASMEVQGRARETQAAKDGQTQKKPPTGPRPRQPNPPVPPDIDKRSSEFIKQKKDNWSGSNHRML